MLDQLEHALVIQANSSLLGSSSELAGHEAAQKVQDCQTALCLKAGCNTATVRQSHIVLGADSMTTALCIEH